MIPEAKQIYEQLQAVGLRPILVTTTHESLPWVVFSSPNLQSLSEYTLQAQKFGPLQAAVGLFRLMVKGVPQGCDPEVLISRTPFVAMRAVQVVLRDCGLDASAEKKSP